MVAAQAAAKSLEIRLEIDPGLPSLLMGDPHRVRQIVLNLLGNAVKFTARGKVVIAVALMPTAEPRVQIAVRDTGIGMSEEMLARLFEPFSQADVSTTRTYGGTGLGLSIVRRLAELMDATVTAASELGLGSTFTLDLPCRAAPNAGTATSSTPFRAASVDAATAQPSSAGLTRRRVPRVLVVEDNAVNQLVVRRFLERVGCEVAVAQDGAAGVAARFAGEFDLVLMDVHMPVMDGLRATREIRQRETEQSRRPIYALTASAMTDELQSCHEAGMDGMLTKPLEPAKLRALLVSLGFSLLESGTAAAAGDKGHRHQA